MSTQRGGDAAAVGARRRTRLWAAALALLLGASLLAGCSGEDSSIGPEKISWVTAQSVLDVRARAVLDDDLDSFLSTIDTSDAGLLAREQRWFANVRQLPWQSFGYTVSESDWPSVLRGKDWPAGTVMPQVRFVSQLREFDAMPVSRTIGFAFAYRDGRPVVVADRTGAGKPFPGSRPAPWDLTKVFPIRSGNALLLFDRKTRSDSSRVISAVDAGVRDVRQAIPFDWRGNVVVYVFANKQVLDSFEDVPGGDIGHLGGMTFPVYAGAGTTETAGIRFTLLPSSLAAGPAFLERITRHELTHVALGPEDDGAPTWVAEGVAEYVAARPLAPAARRIATEAVQRARRGASEMPSSARFNGPDQTWNYALSWMACDYIAETYGEPTLWQLVSEFHATGDSRPDDSQDDVLMRVLGITNAELATLAAERIAEIYG